MTRFKLTIEYDGTPFSGWQKQDNAPSVQENIENAIQQFSHQPCTLYVAGRTDAGVHALGQVAHVDLPDNLDEKTVMRAVNHFLKDVPISILSVQSVTDDFHARFSAVARSYRYRVMNRRAKLSLEENRAWHVSLPLDFTSMKEGARYFLGQHDFTSFRTVHCQAKTTVRTIDIFNVSTDKDEIIFDIKARSFLHHQVRNMVGTLVDIGKGRFQPKDIQFMLTAKDRSVAGPTAPAEGLYFVSVTYP